MIRPKKARLLAIAAGALFAAFACGGNTSGGSSATKGTFKIGVDLPESGAAASSGVPTLNGVKLAVTQMNDQGGINGFKVDVSNFDDSVSGSYNEQKGVQNVQAMIGDSSVLGMVGPFNSAVAKAEIPVAAQSHFTMVSPSNTNPCLTKDSPSCAYHPQDLRKGNPNNYFRVVTTDDLQGPAMADYAYKDAPDGLGIKKIGVLSDSTVFGKGIADAFQQEFQKIGGTFQRKDYDPDSVTDFRTILQGFKDFGALGLYVGGTDDKKACVPRSQMTAIGFNVPYFGGDGIETAQCLDDAGASNQNINSTSAGADATKTDSAKNAVAAFKKQFPGANDFGGYSIQAYDAANALMQAVGRAIKDNNGNMPSREQVRAEMAKTKGFHGAIGTYNFDANGDTDLKIVSVYTSKQVPDPSQTTTVCSTKDKNVCYVWAKQFNFGG
jgi:branched-chain amino acid transport system substrate-binding protein